MRAGRYRQVLSTARARVAEAPLREHRWALLALAQYQAGRQGDALRTLRRARKVLADELGLDPGPDIVALEDAILRQDPSLVAAQLPEPSSVCPYQGLVPYDVVDSDAFFGRETEVAECLQRLSKAGMLVIVGPSGSGKSSLARAGVAAALERHGRRVAIITPGAQPLDALSAISAPGLPPALVVDQCEEAVTLCRDPIERARFFAQLTSHADEAPLIVALRADRFGELSAHPEFARLVERGLYVLKSMDGADLRAAIEGPARQAGLLLEPGLVDLLIRDVEGEPGALPLLSHALRQTWRGREGRTLTVAGYQASGGIRGAVAQSAEQVYEQAPEDQRPILRDLLLRLVTPSPEGETVRSRVPRRVVATDAEHEQIIEQLVKARLVTSDQDVVEIAHESLARAWPRLRSWLDDDVEGQRIWRHLATAADAWEAMGRPSSELYRGVRLARATEWRDRTSPDLTPVEQAFVHASRDAAEAEQRAAEEQAHRQVRINRRLRVLVAGVALLALISVTGGLVAVRQAQRADSEAQRADAEANLARSHELAASAISVLDEDPSLAKLLAVASVTVSEPSLQSISALHRVWAADQSVWRYGGTFEIGLIWADLHPSGDRLVASGAAPFDGSGWSFEVVNRYTDEPLWSVDLADPQHASAFLAAPFFTADGQSLVAGVFWDPYNTRRLPVPFDGVDEPQPELLGAHIWNADTGALLDRFDLGRCGGVVAAASETHLLAKTLHGPADVLRECRWEEGTMGAELVDRRSEQRRLLSRNIGSWLWGAALSGDGRYVAFDDVDSAEIVVADVISGAEILRADGRGVRDVNHDGSLVLLGGSPIEVRHVTTGELSAEFHGHGSESRFARFGPNGRTVYSTGADGALREWDAVTGRELAAYPGAGEGQVSFSDDGLVSVTQPDRDTATLLDTSVRGEVAAIETCIGSTAADSLAVAGNLAAFHTACGDDVQATTHIVELGRRQLLPTQPGHQSDAFAMSPDGSRIVGQEGEGTVHGPLVVRDLLSDAPVAELEGVCGWDDASPTPAAEQPGCRLFPEEPFTLRSPQLRWSPDGSMIASTVEDGLAVWDANTGSLLYKDQLGRANAVDLAFSPDAEQLVVAAEWWIRSLSTATWKVVAEREVFFDGAYHPRLAGFTPDGSTLLAVGGFQTSAAGALHWLDPTTLAARRSKVNVHEGSVRSVALDPDGLRMATGASDGKVRIWDVATGNLVHEIPFGRAVHGVAFVDENRLAVTPADGDLLIVTTDVSELTHLVRASLTRGFTFPECARFGFGDECPTLAELQGAAPRSDILSGSYTIRWTTTELVETMTADAEDFQGFPLPDDTPDGMRDLAADLTGEYTFTFADGRFDVIRDSMEESFCTGTYAVRSDRVWLSAERGWCVEVKFFDAAFDLSDGQLRFASETFRGQYPLKIVFASRPLKKIS